MKKISLFVLFIIIISGSFYLYNYSIHDKSPEKSIIDAPTVSKQTYYLTPDKPIQIDDITISEKLLGKNNQGEISSAQLLFVRNNIKKEKWIDEGGTTTIFGYRIHIISIDLSEGNIQFTIVPVNK